MTRPLLLVFLLGAACAHAPLGVPSEQTATAGVPVQIAPPKGELRTWLAGDGSAAIEGAVFAHTYEKPGRYVVQVDGRDAVTIEVRPRPVLEAIPAQGIATALVFPRGLLALDQQRERIEPLVPSSMLPSLDSFLENELDRSSPAALEALGLDPAEGFAFVQLARDESLWLLVGVLDEKKALAAVGKLFKLESVEPVGEGLFGALTGGGDAILFGVRGGYLAINNTSPADPAGSFSAVLSDEPGSVARSAGFSRARAHAPGEDALIVAPGERSGEWLVAGLTLGGESIEVAFTSTADSNDADQLVRLFGAHGPRPDFAALLPADAAVVLLLSLDPAQALKTVDRREDASMLRGMFTARFGLSLAELAPLFTGHAAIVHLFDPALALAGARALALDSKEPGSLRLAAFLELVDAPDAPAKLITLLTRAGGKRDAKGELVLGNATVRLTDRMVRVTDLSTAAVLDATPTGLALTERLGEAALAREDAQALQIDAARLVEGLLALEPDPSMSPEEAAFYSAWITSTLEPLRAIQDVRIEVHAVPEGLAGALQIRLRPASEKP